MTKEKQAELIQKACLANGISTHIDWIKKKKDANTPAMSLAALFRRKEELPVKVSYMYCDSLDMCFFYGPNGNPSVSFSGVSPLANPDIKDGRIMKAFAKAKEILQTMQELADKEEKTGEK